MSSKSGQFLRYSAGAGFGGLLLPTLDSAIVDPTTLESGEDSVGELSSLPPEFRVRHLSSGSSSTELFNIGGLMLMISRSLGPKNLYFFFVIHGVLFGLIAIRAALDRSTKCVIHMMEPELNSTISARREAVKFASKVPVIAWIQKGRMRVYITAASPRYQTIRVPAIRSFGSINTVFRRRTPMISAMMMNDGIIMVQKTIPRSELLMVRKMISPKQLSPAGLIRVESHVARVSASDKPIRPKVVLLFLRTTVSMGGFSARIVMSRPNTIWNHPMANITTSINFSPTANFAKLTGKNESCRGLAHGYKSSL